MFYKELKYQIDSEWISFQSIYRSVILIRFFFFLLDWLCNITTNNERNVKVLQRNTLYKDIFEPNFCPMKVWIIEMYYVKQS